MTSIDNSTTQKKIQTYVIKLIASVVNSSAPEENTENLDWNEIMDYAQSHSVLNIVAYAVQNLKNKPNAVTVKYLSEFRRQKMVVEAQQEIEAIDAMDKLEKMHVRHMPLKGFVIKNLYPSPDMRTMGDIDILIDSEKCDEVIRSFVEDGFNFKGEGELHSNVERGNAFFEFHRAMIDPCYDILCSYFGDGFSRAKKVDGYEYRYELSPEDMYVFVIAHIAKHYRYGGTGIRTVLDLYVYSKFNKSIDREYIKIQTEKIGLERFRQKVEKIASDWFDGSFNGEYDNVSDYIASGGIYGSKRVHNQNQIISSSKDGISEEKKRRVMSIYFPGHEVMSIRYPVLAKHKWLTPLFWIVRVFDTLIHEPKNAKGRFLQSAEILDINQDQVDVQRDAQIDCF